MTWRTSSPGNVRRVSFALPSGLPTAVAMTHKSFPCTTPRGFPHLQQRATCASDSRLRFRISETRNVPHNYDGFYSRLSRRSRWLKLVRNVIQASDARHIPGVCFAALPGTASWVGAAGRKSGRAANVYRDAPATWLECAGRSSAFTSFEFSRS